MQATVTLSREVDFRLQQFLFPVLLQADACLIDLASPRLTLEFASSAGAELEQALSAQLASIDEPLDWRSAEGGTALSERLHMLEAAVLTIIAPDEAVPAPELLAQLAEWDVDILATRRLGSLAGDRPAAFELYLGRADLDGIRPNLGRVAERWGADLCLQPADDKRPRRRLVVFDMDSTLIECEVIDELAARAGVGDEVAAITARAMRGELDFRSSFRERMSRLRGLAQAELESVAAALPIMPGASRLLRELAAQGHHTAILSGGFDYFAQRLQEQLGITEVHANHLQIADGVLTGEVDGPVVDGERKVALLQMLAQREGFDLADTVAVGDGANDLPMLATAGVGVAFHAKPLVRQRARCAVSYADLSALLYVLGVQEAD